MGFDDFCGNSSAVAWLRRLLASGRLPHALILAGPVGVGRYSLAQMLAKALHCLDREKERETDFCGQCKNCRTIALADDRHAALEWAEQEREKLTRRPRELPLIIRHHPDVVVLPPNGPLRLFQIEQARSLKQSLAFVSTSDRRQVFIIPDAERMDAPAANSLLKSLEEPPPNVLLLLTTSGEAALLPTIRSRCMTIWLNPVQPAEVMDFLRKSGAGKTEQERQRRAVFSRGCPGLALRMDVEHYLKVRDALLDILLAGAERRNFGPLFASIQKLVAEKEGLENLLDVLYSLLHDILHIEAKANGEPLRNVDRPKRLWQVARTLGIGGVQRAAAQISELERNLRRNVSKQLALEAFAISLASARGPQLGSQGRGYL
ncbi:MAG: hypothetical protein A3H27_13420 [Acidobacteria bacterium RIFCSPLOWO2_02_FULL_59_13]|nr:MAG: hypothetical protein A3H27_13420 [Acidobacteria bacterium RIFCSPLOWO2_02_FULL_59_13]